MLPVECFRVHACGPCAITQYGQINSHVFNHHPIWTGGPTVLTALPSQTISAAKLFHDFQRFGHCYHSQPNMTDRHLAIIDTSSSPAALCRARSLHSGLPCRRNIPFSPVKKSSPYCFQHRKRARFNMRWDWNGDRADGFSSDSSGGSDAWEDCHETWSELAEEDTVGREATHLIGGAKTLSGISDAGSIATGLICEGINQLTGERCLRRVRKERLCHHHLREEARMKDKAVYNLDGCI